jgi:hypothetical protein
VTALALPLMVSGVGIVGLLVIVLVIVLLFRLL